MKNSKVIKKIVAGIASVAMVTAFCAPFVNNDYFGIEASAYTNAWGNIVFEKGVSDWSRCDSGMEWEASTNTLYLTNYTGIYETSKSTGTAISFSGFKSSDTINIVVQGANIFNLYSYESETADAIDAGSASLKIGGSGSLTIKKSTAYGSNTNAFCYGLRSDSSITIEDVSVDISGGEAGIIADKNVTISDYASVNTKSLSRVAIVANKFETNNYASVKINSSGTGLMVGSIVAKNESVVDIEECSSDAIVYSGDVKVTCSNSLIYASSSMTSARMVLAQGSISSAFQTCSYAGAKQQYQFSTGIWEYVGMGNVVLEGRTVYAGDLSLAFAQYYDSGYYDGYLYVTNPYYYSYSAPATEKYAIENYAESKCTVSKTYAAAGDAVYIYSKAFDMDLWFEVVDVYGNHVAYVEGNSYFIMPSYDVVIYSVD